MTQFRGRKYQVVNRHMGATAIRFADDKGTGGVATTAYSYSMTNDERAQMARRIAAALNLTSHYTIEELEAAADVVASRGK